MRGKEGGKSREKKGRMRRREGEGWMGKDGGQGMGEVE